MSNYWITTEATADFPESLMKEDFAIIPMSYTVKGEFFDGADKKLTPKQFYDACREAKTAADLPTTSMITAYQAEEFFRPILAAGNDIIHIGFSSALSGTLEQLKMAEKTLSAEFPDRRITVIDSKSACFIEGLAVYRDLVQGLVFGESSPARLDGRITTVQTLGGTGALRIAARFAHDFLGFKRAVVPDPKTVLIAPTWGRAGLLTKTGAAIPKRLAEAGYHVILRPHPQSFVSELPLMESLQKELAGYDNIEWDRNPNGFASLSRAGVMVSDFSGVVFDFAFVFERPVVSIGDGWQKDGYEAWDLPNPAWEMGVLDEIGIHLATGEESKAAEAVEALLKEGDARIERIRRVREAGIRNFGAAGGPISRELLSLLAEVNAPESQSARPAARVSGKEE